MGGITTALGVGPYLVPAALGLMAGSRIMGGISGYQEGKTAAGVYKSNAELAMAQARNKAAQEKDRYKRLAASQRAAYGASGVDVNQGSPLDVLADTDAEGIVSAMQLLYDGRLESANWRQRARSARSAGRNARTGGVLGGLATGLTGVARLSGR